MWRDFTYVDDIVRGTVAALDHPPQTGAGAPHRVYNIGHNKPERLGAFIDILEEVLGVKAVREYEPMQPGDVPRTYADIGAIGRDLDFKPEVGLREGLTRFAEWYRGYFKI
jgi:UDP-glucuronate 4-epimerase